MIVYGPGGQRERADAVVVQDLERARAEAAAAATAAAAAAGEGDRERAPAGAHEGAGRHVVDPRAGQDPVEVLEEAREQRRRGRAAQHGRVLDRDRVGARLERERPDRVVVQDLERARTRRRRCHRLRLRRWGARQDGGGGDQQAGETAHRAPPWHPWRPWRRRAVIPTTSGAPRVGRSVSDSAAARGAGPSSWPAPWPSPAARAGAGPGRAGPAPSAPPPAAKCARRA